MNTKDTIDVLKYHYNIKEGLFKSVVDLLKRGKKYEQMWNKLYKKLDYLSADARYKGGKFQMDKILKGG